MSHFFAYLSKMKYINRWGLMRNTEPENIQEHSLNVALIAHALAIIKNAFYQGKVDPDRAAVLALYHEIGEVIVGDLPAPIKYFNNAIHQSFSDIENIAREKLFLMLPSELRSNYHPLIFPNDGEPELELVKAADKISAYLKCLQELKHGNTDFQKAEKTLKKRLAKIQLPEVKYFMDKFLPSYSLTIDELNDDNS
jgi:5'-deoxynucleotidase